MQSAGISMEQKKHSVLESREPGKTIRKDCKSVIYGAGQQVEVLKHLVCPCEDLAFIPSEGDGS